MIQGPQLIIVLAIILLLFGGSKLPKLARSLGEAQKEFREGLKEGQEGEQAPAASSKVDGGPATTTPPPTTAPDAAPKSNDSGDA